MASTGVQGAGLALGVVGMFVGILSFPLFWVPFLNFMLGGGALVMGIFAHRQGSRGFGMAALIIGIVGSAFGLICTLLWIIGTIAQSTG